MKLVAALLLTWMTTQAWADSFLKEVPQPILGSYIPKGFDTDDTVEIMVAGFLKDSCARIGAIRSDLDSAGRKLSLELTSYEYSGRCLKTKIPFYLPVYVGRIREAGTYAIEDFVSRRAIGYLEIQKPRGGGGGVDDMLYPPLTDAYLVHQGGASTLVLKGILPMDCLAVGDVKVEVQNNVLVAMPKLARIAGQACHGGNFGFTKAVAVKERLPRGMFLLHVRAMGGRSINKMEIAY